MIAQDPMRPSSLARDDIRLGVRSFHLELVSRRRHSASHLVYYKVATDSAGGPEVFVIGVLHEGMEPKRRLNKSLRALDIEDSNPLSSAGTKYQSQ